LKLLSSIFEQLRLTDLSQNLFFQLGHYLGRPFFSRHWASAINNGTPIRGYNFFFLEKRVFPAGYIGGPKNIPAGKKGLPFLGD